MALKVRKLIVNMLAFLVFVLFAAFCITAVVSAITVAVVFVGGMLLYLTYTQLKMRWTLYHSHTKDLETVTDRDLQRVVAAECAARGIARDGKKVKVHLCT